jgi:response regulator RpfG family c-di-GMP phosphodiesterase
MASDRAYRKRMEERIILKVIHEGSGSQFDPDIVAAFGAVYEQGTVLQYMETGQLEAAERFHPLNG